MKGVTGVRVLAATGSCVPGTWTQMTLTNARPSTLVWQIFGVSTGNYPYAGSQLVPAP